MAERECLNLRCASKVQGKHVVCSSCYWEVLTDRQRQLIGSGGGVAQVARELGWMSREEIRSIKQSRF